MKRSVKRAVITLVALAILGAAGYYGYERYKGEKPTIQLVTATVSRGSVVQGIDATGRLQAVTTVQVGSQVSGTIKSLYADFNSQVRKGQLIAELEPSLFQTQVEQAEATVVRGRPMSSARVYSSRIRSSSWRGPKISPRATCCPRPISKRQKPTPVKRTRHSSPRRRSSCRGRRRSIRPRSTSVTP